MRSLVAACATIGLACLASTAHTAPLTPGNLLVTQNNVVIECTTAGAVVQSFPVPYGGGERPITETVRDVVVGPGGFAHVYDGTFDPYFSTRRR